MKTIFTFPGKAGDSIYEWPVAFWWHQENQKPFTVWLDPNTCKMLKSLFEYQDGVEEVVFREGIESWHLGGQPWHFGLDNKEHEEHHIIHLGMRNPPKRQITLETRSSVPITLKVSQEDLANTPSLTCPGKLTQDNRVVLHGTCLTHTNETPQFWRFLAGIRADLEKRFDEIVFVGTQRERDTALQTYTDWTAYNDGGDFLKLASYLQGSRLVIGAGSSVVALSGALKVPTVRVHDPIGSFPKEVWSNLGPMQLNCTEFELRKEWPEFLKELEDHWIRSEKQLTS